MSFLFFFLAIILAVLFFVDRVRRYKSSRYGLNLPPGPPSLPVIGNLHQLGRRPHLSLRRLALAYGPVLRLTLGAVPTVVVSSARAAREVLRTHDLALCSRPQTYAARHLFYGCTDIAFAPYGAYWRHVRKLCILELLSARRVEAFAPARAAEAARMVSRVAAADGATVNLSKVLARYANGVVCRATFGRDFLEGGEYERHGFEGMLADYQELLGGFSLGDFYPGSAMLEELAGRATGAKARLETTFRRFDRLFDEVIEEHLQRKRRGAEEEEEEEEKDLVDVLLELQGSEGLEMPLTRDNVKAVILDMFAAGTDTTFIALDWGMTELLLNPKAMTKARHEVRSIVGDQRLVSEAHITRMHYLKAVVKETLRLHPPAPLLVPRESMQKVKIDSYDVPAKTRVFVNAWAIGRDPEAWGDPERFDPERFVGSLVDYKGQDFELIPFGAGRRGCPAIAFGAASTEVALAQLLHSFDWELPPGVRPEDLDLDEVFGITMHRRDDLEVVAKPHIV
ncbi:cytochrome P450 71A1-like [Ananas comosus]|uniref:Cytochrome P450 71A1-like n=1 Tax=Ananas comosus TaxID=4615 RepID=A0A6P5EI29_ANACO|nr:cytochrome P450 71A1-like [Ananas comosus]